MEDTALIIRIFVWQMLTYIVDLRKSIFTNLENSLERRDLKTFMIYLNLIYLSPISNREK